jgi:hypothetical protein
MAEIDQNNGKILPKAGEKRSPSFISRCVVGCIPLFTLAARIWKDDLEEQLIKMAQAAAEYAFKEYLKLKDNGLH